MTPDLATPSSLVGALVVAIAALSGVIVFLFKHYSRREDERRKHDEDVAKERTLWAVERARLEVDRDHMRAEIRAEFEERHRVVVSEHAKLLRESHDAARENEAAARREYAANIEVVAAKASEAADKIGGVIEKIYERFVLRRPH